MVLVKILGQFMKHKKCLLYVTLSAADYQAQEEWKSWAVFSAQTWT